MEFSKILTPMGYTFIKPSRQISIFKESADIQTADMLNLPITKANYHDEVIQPSEYQKDIIRELASRAELVRNHMVEPYEDNMLKITNDGRKLALDQRLLEEELPLGFADSFFLYSKSTPPLVVGRVLIYGIIFLFSISNDSYAITAKCS